MMYPKKISILLMICGINFLQQSSTVGLLNKTPFLQLRKCLDFSCDNGLTDCDHFKNRNYSFPSKLFANSMNNSSFLVRLSASSLNCENTTEVSVNATEIIHSTKKWVAGRNNFTGFNPDGMFIHMNNIYDTNEFCISGISKQSLSISFCNQICNFQRPCIPRCCGFGSTFDIGNKKLSCVPSGDKDWKPTYYSNQWSDLKLTEKEVKSNGFQPILFYKHPKFWCNPKFAAQVSLRQPTGLKSRYRQKPYKILQDGSVWVKFQRRKWEVLRAGTFCMEGVVRFPEDKKTIEEGYSGLEEDSILFDCDPNRVVTEKPSRSTSQVYGVVLLISSTFLLMTAAVFILLRENQTVHTWTMFGYVVAMTLNYYTLAFNQFTSAFQKRGGTAEQPYFTFCAVMGMLGHFLFLSAFVWLTLVNFDIWWNFRILKPVQLNRKSFKRVWSYLAISLTIPAIIVGIGIALDLNYRNDPFSDVIVPDYGKFRCYMEIYLAPLPYLYGPVAVMMGINTAYYASTVLSIYRVKRSTAFASSNSTKNEKNGDSVKLFGKLLFTMGIPWMWEVISWLIQENETSTPWYIIIGDMLTISQPLLLFFIFVTKKETLNSLKTKYPQLKCMLDCVAENAHDFSKWIAMVKEYFIRLVTCSAKANTSSQWHATYTIEKESSSNSKTGVSKDTKSTDL